MVHLGCEATGLAFRIVDLETLGLALDDEPAMPALGRYTRETTRAWSDLVTAAAGVVIVTPQYNWSVPAPLKNAIDHLYREWKGKPALLVTYGGHGGDKCEAESHSEQDSNRTADELHVPSHRRPSTENGGQIRPPAAPLLSVQCAPRKEWRQCRQGALKAGSSARRACRARL